MEVSVQTGSYVVWRLNKNTFKSHTMCTSRCTSSSYYLLHIFETTNKSGSNFFTTWTYRFRLKRKLSAYAVILSIAYERKLFVLGSSYRGALSRLRQFFWRKLLSKIDEKGSKSAIVVRCSNYILASIVLFSLIYLT